MQHLSKLAITEPSTLMGLEWGVSKETTRRGGRPKVGNEKTVAESSATVLGAEI